MVDISLPESIITSATADYTIMQEVTIYLSAESMHTSYKCKYIIIIMHDVDNNANI